MFFCVLYVFWCVLDGLNWVDWLDDYCGFGFVCVCSCYWELCDCCGYWLYCCFLVLVYDCVICLRFVVVVIFMVVCCFGCGYSWWLVDDWDCCLVIVLLFLSLYVDVNFSCCVYLFNGWLYGFSNCYCVCDFNGSVFGCVYMYWCVDFFVFLVWLWLLFVMLVV